MTKPYVAPTSKQLYYLDSTGYLVIKKAVPDQQIDKALAIVSHTLGNDRFPKFTFLQLDGVFWDIMTNPHILGVAQEVCTEWFRLDHAFGICQTKGRKAVTPHGGTGASRGCHHWGSEGERPVCHGQLSVSVALTDAGGDLGGISVLPGSHKSCFVKEGREMTDWFSSEDPFICPKLEAGDVLIMPENLFHGNKAWTSRSPRLSLYYMYFPTYSTYRLWDEQQKEHAKFARNELERRLYRPPGVAKIDDSKRMLGRNIKPSPTIPYHPSQDHRQ